MFKIAIDAGHYLKTPGKRVPKALDPAQTREWTLNDRVARYLAEAAQGYENTEILRVDDPTGKKQISLASRCKAANQWGADVYISCHHNAGIKLGSGGGIVAYCYKTGTKAAEYRDAIYKACIAAGGLKGNRSNPTPEKGYYVLKNTKAPAVLMEYGFMDSKTDAPVILTEAYSQLVGYATMEGIAKAAGLQKIQNTNETAEESTVKIRILRKSNKGEQVRAMQLLLIGRGFSCGKSGADGSFGAATDSALRAFQEKAGIAVNGVCDPVTWAALLGAAG